MDRPLVIIVDDEPTHAGLLAEGLARMGYQPRVHTGRRASAYALAEAQTGAFDGAAALILDLDIDQVYGFFNGGELLRALRHLNITAPACLLSGVYVDDRVRDRLAEWFDAVVEKPARVARLLRFLEEHVGEARRMPTLDAEDSRVTALSSLH